MEYVGGKLLNGADGPSLGKETALQRGAEIQLPTHASQFDPALRVSPIHPPPSQRQDSAGEDVPEEIMDVIHAPQLLKVHNLTGIPLSPSVAE